jgi:hypothetical protein
LRQLEGLVTEFREREILGEAHIWAGDFNSVTREDYTETEWTKLEEDRKGLHMKNCEYDTEPKMEVAAKMVELDLNDCWLETGKKGIMATCRLLLLLIS